MAVLSDASDSAVNASGRMLYKHFTDFFGFIGEFTSIGYASIRRIIAGEISVPDTINQMALIGANSLPIVFVTTAFSGAVLSLYTSQTMVQWGVGNLVGGGVSLSVARELAPVLTGIVVAARAGSAIAAEVGTMKVTEQIDALRSLGTSPIQYLAVPRLLALVIMLPILTMLGDVVGSFGGYVVASSCGVPSAAYLNSAQLWLTPYDVVMGLVKTVFFGAFIAIVGVQQGMAATGGAAGVGRRTMNAVVISMILIYVSNYFLASIMFGAKRPGF